MRLGQRVTLILALSILAACSSTSASQSKHYATFEKATLRLSLDPQASLAPGKPTVVFAKLNMIEDRSLITDDQLEEVHNAKIHLLVVDPTLTDYQHIHPQPTKTPGLYSFTFTPKLAGGYRAWADITLKANHKQMYVMADLGAPRHSPINKVESHEASVLGYHFALTFDKPPVVGDESVGTVKVTDKDGDPVSKLEPIMGSYAHVVGFYSDFRTIVHVHPMGAEPSDSDHGGPDVTFHLDPEKSGFLKLFVQVKIGGKELFVPFGVIVSGTDLTPPPPPPPLSGWENNRPK